MNQMLVILDETKMRHPAPGERLKVQTTTNPRVYVVANQTKGTASTVTLGMSADGQHRIGGLHLQRLSEHWQARQTVQASARCRWRTSGTPEGSADGCHHHRHQHLHPLTLERKHTHAIDSHQQE